MRRREFLGGALALGLLLGGASLPAPAQEPTRVLSIGGTVTEIVHALGQGDRLIARDTTSTFPPAVAALPDVGYMRALSPEGVLSVDPGLILAEDGAGPPATMETLRGADIRIVTVPGGHDAGAVVEKIRVIGAALGVADRAATLAAGLQADFARAQAASNAVGRPKRVLFILSAQGGKILAGGQDTSADAIIRLAGGVNAVQGFAGFKPLTDEAALEAAPDVVLMMARGGGHAMTAEDLFALPALASSPAADRAALVTMDGLKLLGFGPRTPDAIRALHAALYGG